MEAFVCLKLYLYFTLYVSSAGKTYLNIVEVQVIAICTKSFEYIYGSVAA